MTTEQVSLVDPLYHRYRGTVIGRGSTRYRERISSEEGRLAWESRESGRELPQIDPAINMEVLATIQSRMDGIEARLERQADDPLVIVLRVSEPIEPQIPSQPPRHRKGPMPEMKIT